ncbi:efflux RND transporter permease subunit [Zhenhengia yiwuensis]|uniref:efflux RND transporter permease subunit n=1 Tax=Zhenhengia yiwuensis TaxID=2763666 RepID=UPI002A74D168|nr:MMPL family transporter [Zhenhengia yiwuensis]MDY3369653.1 MMPL family transporter [Zhenhengia yiwuensis]
MSETKPTVMEQIAAFIVDKRNLLFLMYILAIVFCFFSMRWVDVENDITAYLSEDTETRQGLTVMDKEFVTFGTAKIMISNISYEHAQVIADELKEIQGVTKVEFDHTIDHYKDASALLSLTFEGEEDDPISMTAMNEVRDRVSSYDTSISTSIGVNLADQLAREMQIIIVIAAFIIIVVLLFTSKTYGEIPVLIITFIVAAVLNMGTNFLLGKISFISNSVAVVLQLALAIDYAIILCHRFSEEHEQLPTREACIIALSKAIPEISSSSLTTISGLGALIFMHFKIGEDLAFVLIKSILLSLLSVFTLMPGLLMLFSKIIDKTSHKNFVPSINIVGKFVVKTRYIIPPIFLVILVLAFIFANKCPYVYGTTDLRAARRNDTQIAEDRIKETFGTDNLVALIVPSGDYGAEGKLLNKLESYEQVKSTLGLANTEAIDGYMLTDSLTPRQFAELIDLDYEAAKLLYSAYAVHDEAFGKVVNGLSEYGVPLIDMFMFLYDQVDKGYITLEDELMDTLEDLNNNQLTDAKLQLMSEQYSRMLIYLNLPEESDETFAFLETIHDEAAQYYEEEVYIVGNSTSNYNLSSTFGMDNIIISILSALFVIGILMFTFKSAGLPVLLILVIQASIWMNFSFPYLQNTSLFFLGYLVVSSIQMGANIDYAIVITSRYMVLKKSMPIKEAIIEALNQSFPTIITSGAILASAGILIGQITTDGTIASIGVCLGRGTIISMVLVMFVLPQILVLGDSIIKRTAFAERKQAPLQKASGKLYVSGRVKGYVSGIVDADISGVITGEVHAMIDSKEIRQEEPANDGKEFECYEKN